MDDEALQLCHTLAITSLGSSIVVITEVSIRVSTPETLVGAVLTLDLVGGYTTNDGRQLVNAGWITRCGGGV